jgi:hypothetical protein
MNKNEISMMINFAYFAANFPSDFIRQVWPYDNGHFQNKLLDFAMKDAKGYVTLQSFLEFFFSLSISNQKRLCAWIEKTYHFSSEHK